MNLLLWTAHVDETHAPLLGELAAAGFDGVEIPLFEGDAAHYRGLRAELDRAGPGCTTVTVASRRGECGEPRSGRASSVRRAHALGARDERHPRLRGHLRPDAPGAGRVHGRRRREDELARAADALRIAAELAEDTGVTIALEYLNRFEALLPQHGRAGALPSSSASTIRACARCTNTFHGHIEEKHHAEAIRTVAPVMADFHVSENDRGEPGSGQVRFDEAFGGAARDRLRRLDHDRGLRQRTARPGSSDQSLARRSSKASPTSYSGRPGPDPGAV